jgi:hypothetical protein
MPSDIAKKVYLEMQKRKELGLNPATPLPKEEQEKIDMPSEEMNHEAEEQAEDGTQMAKKGPPSIHIMIGAAKDLYGKTKGPAMHSPEYAAEAKKSIKKAIK